MPPRPCHVLYVKYIHMEQRPRHTHTNYAYLPYLPHLPTPRLPTSTPRGHELSLSLSPPSLTRSVSLSTTRHDISAGSQPASQSAVSNSIPFPSVRGSREAAFVHSFIRSSIHLKTCCCCCCLSSILSPSIYLPFMVILVHIYAPSPPGLTSCSVHL